MVASSPAHRSSARRGGRARLALTLAAAGAFTATLLIPAVETLWWALAVAVTAGVVVAGRSRRRQGPTG